MINNDTTSTSRRVMTANGTAICRVSSRCYNNRRSVPHDTRSVFRYGVQPDRYRNQRRKRTNTTATSTRNSRTGSSEPAEARLKIAVGGPFHEFVTDQPAHIDCIRRPGVFEN